MQDDMTKVTWTIVHITLAGKTFLVAVDGAQPRIEQTAQFRSLRFVRFGMFDSTDAHSGRFVWRKNAELHLSHAPQRCRRVLESVRVHLFEEDPSIG